MEPRRTDSPASVSAAAGRAGTGYRVETSGRVLLPEVLEEQLLPALRDTLTGCAGRFDGLPTSGLEDVARAVGVRAVRDDDHVLLVTDRDGDITWTEQNAAFFAALAGYVSEGEVHFRGEDGAAWSLRYGPAGAKQEGVNGFDGSTALPPLRSAGTSATAPLLPPPGPPREPSPEPAAGLSPERAADPTPEPTVDPTAGPPPESAFTADEPAPRSPARAFGMAVLFLGGVFMILLIAIVASGLG